MSKYELYAVTKEQFESKEDCLFSTPAVEADTLQGAVTQLSELTHKVLKGEIDYDPEYTLPSDMNIVKKTHRRLICFNFDVDVIMYGPEGTTFGLIVIL